MSFWDPENGVTLGSRNPRTELREMTAGGDSVPRSAGNVPLDTKWSYPIGLTGGNTISLIVNGGTKKNLAAATGLQQLQNVLQSR
jgi:hypothetical protein